MVSAPVFNMVLERLEAGDSLFAASINAGVTPADLMEWVMAQPNAKALQATMQTVRADRLQRKAELLQEHLSQRIDAGLVRTRAMAEVEQVEIARLWDEAEKLRFMAIYREG